MPKVPDEPQHNDTGGPIWFFWKGNKFDFIHRKNRKLLFLGASAASISIRRHSVNTNQWHVDWELRHHPDWFSKGSIIMDTQTLLVVFSSSKKDMPVRYHKELTERVGADFFIPGVACRWHEYVTLPNIGTGIAYDSNVSILITPEIQEAVKQLVSDVGKPKSSRARHT